MKKLDIVAAALLVISGLNWALVGVARFDLVARNLRNALRRDFGAEFRGVPAGRAVGRVPSCLVEGDSATLEWGSGPPQGAIEGQREGGSQQPSWYPRPQVLNLDE